MDDLVSDPTEGVVETGVRPSMQDVSNVLMDEFMATLVGATLVAVPTELAGVGTVHVVCKFTPTDPENESEGGEFLPLAILLTDAFLPILSDPFTGRTSEETLNAVLENQEVGDEG